MNLSQANFLYFLSTILLIFVNCLEFQTAQRLRLNPILRSYSDLIAVSRIVDKNLHFISLHASGISSLGIQKNPAGISQRDFFDLDLS